MGIIKRAGDLVYTFRFLRLLTTKFEDTEAFKIGLIDENGKRLRKPETPEERDVYTPFIRLVFNIKKIMAKVPLGGTRLASYAAALYLIKEKFGINDKQLQTSLKEMNIDTLDFLSEQSEWFILEDGRLTPGFYKVLNDKLLNDSLEEMVKARDKIKISEHCYPVGEMFGVKIYEAIHVRTNKTIYVSVAELAR